MSAQGIRAGRAYVELGTNDSKLKAGLQAAQDKLKSWGKSAAIAGGAMSGVGAAVLGPMLGATAVFASSGDELSKMADKTGASVESLSELRHAANQSAVDFKQLGSAMNKQQRNLAEAAAGNKTASEAFETLGLSVDDLMKLSPDQQFETIADKISQIQDPAKRTAAAMDIIGKSGAELMPLMIGGAKGIQTLRKEARDLGLQVSAKDAAAATKFGDTWANVQTTLKQIAFNVGAALAPALTSLMEAVIPIIVKVANWISQNRQLVVTVAAIAAGVMAAGAALVGIGGVLAAAGIAIGALMTPLAAIAPLFAAVVSPVGLLIGGVVALTAAFLTWTDTGKQVTSWLGGEFSKLVSIITDTVNGMFNALKSGRLELAAEIAFTGLKLTIATIMESVLSLFGSSIKDMAAKFGWLLKKWNETKATIRQGADQVGSWWGNVQAKWQINEQIQKIIRRHQKAGTVGSDQYIREITRQQQALLDVDNYSKGASKNANDQILEDLAQENAAIDKMMEDWSSSADPAALRQKLDELNRQAAEPKTAPESSPGTKTVVADRTGSSGGPMGLGLAMALGPVQEMIRQGMFEAKSKQEKAFTQGSFSSEQAARMGGPADSIPKQQLDELKGINKHVKRTADKRGGVAKP